MTRHWHARPRWPRHWPQRNSEYGERIEQQSATIDVLKVMSASPGDPQPVFELIVERARAFCGAEQCTVALLDGDMLHLKAKAGMSEASARNYAAQFPRPVNTASMFGRAILAREAVQTPDVLADPEHFSRTRVGGPDPEFRAIVAVPMLRAGTPIGAIALVRRMPGVYSAIQMELLQTFAEQAVIAITSAETYRALQTRTSDLQEIAGIPDRDQRRAEGHQPLDLRFATSAGYGGRDRRAAMRCRSGRNLPARG